MRVGGTLSVGVRVSDEVGGTLSVGVRVSDEGGGAHCVWG